MLTTEVAVRPDAELVARCRAGDANAWDEVAEGAAEGEMERLGEAFGHDRKPYLPAEHDAAFRSALVADLEQALRSAGVEPRRRVVDHLRKLLDA